MVKNTVIIFLTLCLFSSCYPSKRLQNGTKVLSRKFKNLDKFDMSVYLKIDPDYFYKEMESYEADSDFKHVVRYWSGPSGRKLQFYQNGCIRSLSYRLKESADPEISGRRGIIYMKNQEIKIDMQSADQDGTLSKMTFKVVVEGNRIYLVEQPVRWFLSSGKSLCFVYQKAEKVPEEWKEYKADW